MAQMMLRSMKENGGSPSIVARLGNESHTAKGGKGAQDKVKVLEA